MTQKRVALAVAAVVFVLAACGPAATATPALTTTPRATATPGGVPASVATATPQSVATPTSPKPAATAGPTRGGLIKYAWEADPQTWDPVSRLEPSIRSKGNVFSRLFTLWPDPAGQCNSELTPWLVERWRWVDDRTAEFTIRQGVKFHNKPPVNGREAVAQDVIFTLNEWVREGLVGPKLKLVQWEAVDKYTFRLKASFPWGGMVLETLGHDYGPMVMAPETAGTGGRSWGDPKTAWIGTGAFVFQEWQPGVKWTMARNPDYWKAGRPLLDGIEYWVMPDISTQMAAMRAGKINLARGWGEIQTEDIKRALPGIQVLRCPASSNTPGAIFMNTEGPPFNDLRVRRAVSMAIDRQTIVNVPHQGKAIIAPVLRPGIPYAMTVQDFAPEVRQYLEYHPDRSRQLLAQAGYPNGIDTVLNIRIYRQQNDQAVWEAVGEMLTQVGIKAKLEFMEYGRYTATVLAAEYPVGQMAGGPVGQRTPEEGHSLANPSFKYGGTTNRSRVNDPDYEKTLEQFMGATDENRRLELARQLQIRHVDQAYRVVLPFPFELLVLSPNVRLTGDRSTQDRSAQLETAWIAR